MTKKCHQWTKENNIALLRAVEDCHPLFEHYRNQSMAYTELNAWDAIAGRLLPDVCVTGAACKRQFEKIKNTKVLTGWDDVVEMVNIYERELAETTFDGVSELLGNFDALFDAVKNIKSDIEEIKRCWE